MGSLRWVVFATIGACGSPKPPPAPTRIAAESPPLAPPPVKAADVAAFTRESLPEWPVVMSDSHDPPEGETEVYAADVDADELLLAVADWDVLMLATQKRLTGRVKTDAPMHAFATIAAQLGVPERGMTVPKANATSAPITLRIAAAPFADVMNAIGDVGNVNVVLPPYPFPALDVAQRAAPWKSLLAATIFFVEHAQTASGNTHYVHKPDVKLPPLGTYPNIVVDLDAREATLGQAVAALASVTKLGVGACSNTPVRLKLRKVKLAEAIRALEYASGEKLTKGGACPIEKTTDTSNAKHVATATSGTKRAFAYERDGKIFVGSTAPVETPAPAPSFKRTAALVHGRRTPATAVMETSTGWRRLGSEVVVDGPYFVRAEIHDDEVVFLGNTNAIVDVKKLELPK